MSIDINSLLDEGVSLVADLYIDTLFVTRDQRGTADATLDRNTGSATQPEPITVYNGPGKMRPSNRAPAETGEGGKSNHLSQYECAIPLSAPVVMVGDYVECTASDRDPALVGKQVLVVAAQGNTLSVQRKFTAEEAVNVRRLRP